MWTGDEMKPRLLLVEDDPTSLQFMRAVLEQLPAHVDSAVSVAEALATGAAHDLWLLDANLPDGSGIELLAQLRARLAASARVPALAHTADHSPHTHSQLLASGFDEVMLKPLGAAQLQVTVKRWLGDDAQRESKRIAEPAALPPLWDETSALAALNGSHANLAALRSLFLGELQRQREAIAEALSAEDFAGARHQLHQLRAGSGFVGASRLCAAAARLEQNLGDPQVARDFEAVAQDTCSTA